MDNLKKSNRKLYYYAIVLALVVVLVPVAYSATEPSVIINMENSQTQKPLIIKDNLGVEVFSVDVDGTVFPAPVIPSGDIGDQSTISYSSPSETIVAGNQNHNHVENPLLLYHVTVNNNGLPDRKTLIMESLLIGGGQKLVGTGTCRVGWIDSQDNGVSWDSVLNDDLQPTFLEVLLTSSTGQYSTGITDIAFAFYNTDGITVCSLTNIQSFQTILEVTGYTYTRVI